MTPTFKTFAVATPMLAAGLILTACNQQSEPAAPVTPDAATDPVTPATEASSTPVLAKVDLTQPVRVLGAEPSWFIDITPSTLTLDRGTGTPKQIADNKGPVVQGETAVFETQTQAGVAIQLTLTAKDCSDTMSDRIYPLSASAKVGNETLTGCAASLRALESAGESGRVE